MLRPDGQRLSRQLRQWVAFSTYYITSQCQNFVSIFLRHSVKILTLKYEGIIEKNSYVRRAMSR